MKGFSADLWNVIQKDLSYHLDQLEEKRQKVVFKVKIGMAVVTLFFIWFGLSVTAGESFWARLLVTCFMGFIGGVLFFFIADNIFARNHRREFKETIISRIMQAIDPNLTYKPDGAIPKSSFMHSRLFSGDPATFTGEDYISGTIDGVNIAMSELRVREYRTSVKRQYSDSREDTTHKELVTIFAGLFFMAEFEQSFSDIIRVEPKVGDLVPEAAREIVNSFLNQMTDKLEQLNVILKGGQDNRIEIGDPEFDRNFIIYGDDPIQVNRILTPELRQRIMDYRKKYSRMTHLSFIDSTCYVAIPYQKNLFEPKHIFASYLDFTMIEEYFRDVEFTVGLANDLKQSFGHN